MTKLTNVKALEMVLGMEEVKGNSELVEKLGTMLAQFQKKSTSGVKKPTKGQQENEGIKIVIMEILDKATEPLQIKEMLLMEGIKEKEYSNQKISALLRQMVKDGIVERVEEKKVARFKMAE